MKPVKPLIVIVTIIACWFLLARGSPSTSASNDPPTPVTPRLTTEYCNSLKERGGNWYANCMFFKRTLEGKEVEERSTPATPPEKPWQETFAGNWDQTFSGRALAIAYREHCSPLSNETYRSLNMRLRSYYYPDYDPSRSTYAPGRPKERTFTKEEAYLIRTSREVTEEYIRQIGEKQFCTKYQPFFGS